MIARPPAWIEPVSRREQLAAHWRHGLLLALASGLLVAPLPAPVLLVAAALAASVAGWSRAGAGVVLAAVLAVLVGAALGDARIAALDQSSLGPAFGREVEDVVEVLEAPRTSPFGTSMIARFRGERVLLRLPSQDGTPSGARGAVAVEVRSGSLLRVRGRLRAPSDFARSRRTHGELRAVAVTLVGRRGGWRGAVDDIRRRAQSALEPHLRAEDAGLLRGMVLGDDSALPVERRDELRAAGLGHLVAASGQNVALLAALGAAAGALLGVSFRLRVALMLALVALYVPLAGAGPSIQRAGVMGGAVLVATLAGRAASRWYAVGLAAVVTLLLDPRSAADPGWQLSFAAVLGLLVLARPARDALRRRGVGSGLAEAVAVTGVATLVTAPIAAAHFGTVSLASLPANVLVAPVVAPITWLGMLGAIAGQLHPVLGAPFALLAAPLLAFVLLVGETAAAFPHATVGPATGATIGLTVAALLLPRARSASDAPRTGEPDRCRATGDAAGGGGTAVAEAVVAAGAVVLAFLAGGIAGTVGVALALRRRLAAAVLVLAAAGLGWAQGPHGPPPVAAFRVTFLDVGEGDAILLQDRENAVLVDAGVPGSGVEDRLREAGVDRLDLLVVTHADADHAGGVPDVLDAVDADLVLDGRDHRPSPADQALATRRRTEARAGQVLTVGTLRLTVLSPSPTTIGETNDRAIILLAEAAGQRVLLPADVESPTLAPLALPPVDVLKVSHHGSADPGLTSLLRRLRPQLAGIEVGDGNRFGHPAASTLQALQSVPAVVRTDRDGTVRADLEDGRWVVRRGA